ncbi:MAG: ferrous iron transport protein A [Phycisphaeraceae bacterium]|nr:ferrous iron transport protein A [Phycisphaeraceae bacterium]
MAQTKTPASISLNQLMPTGVKLSLCELGINQVGLVVEVDESDQVQADRLKALGICVGRRVELIKQGNPMILRVLGTRIGLARRLAKRITVDACHQANCCE